MSKARKAAQHTIVLTASRLLCMLIGIVSVYFYTRVLEPFDLALIPVSAMLSLACYTISNMGLGLYVQRKMPAVNETDPVTAMLMGRAMIAVMIVPLAICCLVVFVASGVIADWLLKDRQAGNLIILMIPVAVATSWQWAAVQIMRGRSLFVELSIFRLVAQIIHPAAVIVLYLWFGSTGLIVGLIIGNAVPTVLATWVIRDYVFGRVDWKYTIGLLSKSWPFYGEGYGGYLTSFTDQWVIGLLLGPWALATYYVPKTLFTRLSTLSDAVHTVAMANLSAIGSHGLDAVKSAFERVRRVYVFIFVPACAALLGASFFLVDVLAGPKAPGGVIPFAILCIALLVTVLYMPHSIGIMTWTAPKKRLIVVLVQGLVILGAAIPLTWIWGLAGTAGALVVGKAAAGILSSRMLGKLFPFSVDWSAIFAVILPSVVLLAICEVAQVLSYHRLTVPLYLAVGLAAYVYLFMQRIPEQDIRMTENILPSRLGWIVALARRCRR